MLWQRAHRLRAMTSAEDTLRLLPPTAPHAAHSCTLTCRARVGLAAGYAHAAIPKGACKTRLQSRCREATRAGRALGSLISHRRRAVLLAHAARPCDDALAGAAARGVCLDERQRGGACIRKRAHHPGALLLVVQDEFGVPLASQRRQEACGGRAAARRSTAGRQWRRPNTQAAGGASS